MRRNSATKWIRRLWQAWTIYQFLAWLGTSGATNFVLHSFSKTVQNASPLWQGVLYVSVALLMVVIIRVVWERLGLRQTDSSDWRGAVVAVAPERSRPTAIRLGPSARNARLDHISGVGNLDLIDNEGAPDMVATDVRLTEAQVRAEDASLRTLLSEDKDNLGRGIHVCKSSLSFQGFRQETEPYIDIEFEIHDMSMLRLIIGNQISGYTRFRNQPLTRRPEVLQTIQIDHTFNKTFTVRQGLSAETALAMTFYKDVDLWMGGVDISVETFTPSGGSGPTGRLPIPSNVWGRVPDDLPHQSWMGMHLA
jgi:hypothetical protein